MKDFKFVIVKDIKWYVMSANERACTVRGRHFMASRCHTKSAWYLREQDQNIAETGQAREISYLPYKIGTVWLSMAVLELLGGGEPWQTRDEATRPPLIHLVTDAPLSYLERIEAFSEPVTA